MPRSIPCWRSRPHGHYADRNKRHGSSASITNKTICARPCAGRLSTANTKPGCGWRRRLCHSGRRTAISSEGRRWLATLLAAGTGQMTTLRVRALVGAGRLAYLHAAYDEAMALDRESLALARTIGDEQGIAAALTELGMVSRLQRDLPRSTQLLEEGLARYRALGDEAGIAYALLNLGSTVSSWALLEESIARYRGTRRSAAHRDRPGAAGARGGAARGLRTGNRPCSCGTCAGTRISATGGS